MNPMSRQEYDAIVQRWSKFSVIKPVQNKTLTIDEIDKIKKEKVVVAKKIEEGNALLKRLMNNSVVDAEDEEEGEEIKDRDDEEEVEKQDPEDETYWNMGGDFELEEEDGNIEEDDVQSFVEFAQKATADLNQVNRDLNRLNESSHPMDERDKDGNLKARPYADLIKKLQTEQTSLKAILEENSGNLAKVISGEEKPTDNAASEFLSTTKKTERTKALKERKAAAEVRIISSDKPIKKLKDKLKKLIDDGVPKSDAKMKAAKKELREFLDAKKTDENQVKDLTKQIEEIGSEDAKNEENVAQASVDEISHVYPRLEDKRYYNPRIQPFHGPTQCAHHMMLAENELAEDGPRSPSQFVYAIVSFINPPAPPKKSKGGAPTVPTGGAATAAQEQDGEESEEDVTPMPRSKRTAIRKQLVDDEGSGADNLVGGKKKEKKKKEKKDKEHADGDEGELPDFDEDDVSALNRMEVDQDDAGPSVTGAMEIPASKKEKEQQNLEKKKASEQERLGKSKKKKTAAFNALRDAKVEEYKAAGSIVYVIMNKLASDDSDDSGVTWHRAPQTQKHYTSTKTEKPLASISAFVGKESTLARIPATSEELYDNIDSEVRQGRGNPQTAVDLFPDGKKNPRGFLPKWLIALLSSASMFGEPMETRICNGIVKNFQQLSSMNIEDYKRYNGLLEADENTQMLIDTTKNTFTRFPDSGLYGDFVKEAITSNPDTREKFTVVKCTNSNLFQAVKNLSEVGTGRAIPYFTILDRWTSGHFAYEKVVFPFDDYIRRYTIEPTHLSQLFMPNIKDIVQLLAAQSVMVFSSNSINSGNFAPEKNKRYILDLLLSNPSLEFRRMWTHGMPMGLVISMDPALKKRRADERYYRDAYLWPGSISLGLWLFVLAWGEYKRYIASSANSKTSIDIDPNIATYLHELAECLHDGIYTASRAYDAAGDLYDRSLFVRAFGTMPENLVKGFGSKRLYQSVTHVNDNKDKSFDVRIRHTSPVTQIIHHEELKIIYEQRSRLGKFAQHFVN